MRESELLFPSESGSFRSNSVLKKPFAQVAKAIGLKKRITPRGMRRTFQDLARAASVGDLVTRAISGHATEDMQRHYSTVGPAEIRAGLERVAHVVSLADFKAGRAEATVEAAAGGVLGGVIDEEAKEAERAAQV